MKIYGDVISPFVRMCLVTASEAGLEAKVTFVKSGVKPMDVNADLQRLSPIAKIPVLETDHGHAIHDSRVIMEYLAHVSGHGELIPDDGAKRFPVLTLLATAQGLAEAGVALRYEQAQRPQEKFWPDYANRLQARILAVADDVEAHSLKLLESVHVGAIGLACALGYLDFRHQPIDWRKGRPGLAAFAERFNARPSMAAWPLS
jgi:glutathione S-transferase